MAEPARSGTYASKSGGRRVLGRRGRGHRASSTRRGGLPARTAQGLRSVDHAPRASMRSRPGRAVPTQCPRPVLAHPADCACTDRKGPIAGHTLRHQCQPTELCGASAVHPVSGSIPLPLCSAYLSVVHVSMHDFRDVTRTGPTRQGSIAALRQQVHRVAVLWAALASLNASLPLHVLVSGDNASESVNAIQRQQLEGLCCTECPTQTSRRGPRPTTARHLQSCRRSTRPCSLIRGR